MDVEEARAKYLVGLVGGYVEKESRVAEVGCRAGNNLVALWRAGFTRLWGMESSAAKVGLFVERHPEIVERAVVAAGPIEELVCTVADSAFDLVFTVGFLFDREGEHSRLFPELARITGRLIISIEEESTVSLKAVYEGLGFREVESTDLNSREELQSVFFSRVFEKTT